MLERAGKQGYRSSIQMSRSRRFRIGYASQSNLLPFTATVTDGLVIAASEANVDLLIANNGFSPKVALQNADKFIAEKVDLVVDSQINVAVAAQIAAKFSDARIPFIALDIPHPGAVYFGADNYKAGRMAGRHLAKWTDRHWKANAEQLILLGVDAAGPLLNARSQVSSMASANCFRMAAPFPHTITTPKAASLRLRWTSCGNTCVASGRNVPLWAR